MSEQALQALRVRIDNLDEQILELISQRARCAQEVGHIKMASLAEGEEAIFYRPEREAQVLKRIMELNKGPLDNEEMARLFREIMSTCLALEQPLKVAYLGQKALSRKLRPLSILVKQLLVSRWRRSMRSFVKSLRVQSASVLCQ